MIMNRTSIINYDVLWDRISNFARKAGRMSTRPVLILWFVLKSKETSKADKMLIISTLSYLVLPIDILDAKRLPFIGWIDEIASLSVTYQKVARTLRQKWRQRWMPFLTGGFLNIHSTN